MAESMAKKEDKEEKQLSLFSNERHEDLAAIIGAAFCIVFTVILF